MQKILGNMRKAIQQYGLISNGDYICVGVSGGKDSMIMLNGLVLLKRFIGIDYNITALTIDPQFGGKEGDYTAVADFCSEVGVEYHIERTHIGEIVFDVRKEENPCSLCARMRRGALYN
ncbi:MAG: tRNA 2-thiocytidine(32) synthetase TtcA, partial [Ruminococcus sp.]|nr:tRNA 2-thiocytidine(32) synthetase TtcA [Ruminococcus sp.]